MIKYYKKNTDGKDWIVGDIHSRVAELMQSLKVKGFNFKNDRLFSVGDLFDRGNEHKKALELVSKDWFFPVRGNHDQMIIDQFEKEQVLQWGYKGWGPKEVHANLEGQWFAELSQDEQSEFYESLKDLPYLIEVETSSGLVGICHAGLPRYIEDWNELKAQLGDRSIREQVIRTRRAPRQNRNIRGVDITVHGHTGFNCVIKNGNGYWIDTFDMSGFHSIIELDWFFSPEMGSEVKCLEYLDHKEELEIAIKRYREQVKKALHNAG